MATNFYVRGHRGDSSPEYHIGKRSASTFIWAMARDQLATNLHDVTHCPMCEVQYADPEYVIEDERRRKYTLEEFYHVLEDCSIQSNELVGEHFS